VESKVAEPTVGRKYQHIEDLVFTNGSRGGLHAVERLGDMQESGGIEIKWDGMPVVYWGEVNGKFTVLMKNALAYLKRGVREVGAGIPTLATGPQDVADFVAGTGRVKPGQEDARQALAQDMGALWQYLRQASPKKGLVEGGLLFHPGSPAVLNKDTNEYEFKPNVTKFHIPADSDLGKRIANAKVMVAVTGYHEELTAPEGRLDNVENLSTADTIVQGTTYTEAKPKLDDSGLTVVERYISSNASKIDDFIGGQPGLTRPGDVLYKFYNQTLRIPGAKKGFTDWVQNKLSAGQAEKILKHPGLDATLNAVEMITGQKNLVLKQLGSAKHGDIRQTDPEGYVQAHPGKEFKSDLPGQFIKMIDQPTWTPNKNI
jgi:hypothetical protein